MTALPPPSGLPTVTPPRATRRPRPGQAQPGVRFDPIGSWAAIAPPPGAAPYADVGSPGA